MRIKFVLPGIDGITDLGITDPEYDKCDPKDDWDKLLDVVNALDENSKET